MTKWGAGNLESAIEEACSTTLKRAVDTRDPSLQTLINLLLPGHGEIAYAVDVAWRHREQIISTAERIAQIWADDTAPVTERAVATLIEGGRTLSDIVLEESKEVVAQKVSDAVADAATGLLKEAGVPHLMIENTPLRGFEDTIIEMIHDSLEKETNRFLLEEVLA